MWHETHKCKVHICMNTGLKKKSLPGVTQCSHLQTLCHLNTEPLGPKKSKSGKHLVKKTSEVQDSSEKGLLALGYGGGGSWGKL